jgi:hypothetical protein
VWRHGGVDGRPGRGHADLCPKDGPAVDGGDDFCSMCMRYSVRVY